MSKVKNLQKEDFAARLRMARKGKGLTQQELGDEIGVTKQAVSDWENPKKETIPEQEKLDKLYLVLDFDAPQAQQTSTDKALSLAEKAMDALTAQLAVAHADREQDVNRFENDKACLRSDNSRLLALLERWGTPPTAQ